MNLLFDIALSHLRSRRRQTIVSLLGVVFALASRPMPAQPTA